MTAQAGISPVKIKMTAQSGISPVVSKQFCSTSRTLFTVRKRPCTVHGGGFVATDCEGNEVFRVEGCGPFVKGRAVLNDGEGRTILTMRRKGGVIQALSLHKQWNVYPGDVISEDEKPIFRVISSTICPERSPVKVLLTYSHKEGSKPKHNTHDWDYAVEGNFSDRRCTVYDDAGNVVAEVAPNYVISKETLSKDIYRVVVHPGYDQAFIFGLIVVLEKLCGED